MEVGYFFLGLLIYYPLSPGFRCCLCKVLRNLMFVPLQATGLQRSSASRLLPFYSVLFQLHCVVPSREFSVTNLLRFVSFITSGKFSFIILKYGLTSIFLCCFLLAHLIDMCWTLQFHTPCPSAPPSQAVSLHLSVQVSAWSSDLSFHSLVIYSVICPLQFNTLSFLL